MTKERIKYIDALRGFTMLVVVFLHVENFCFGIEPYKSTLGSILVSFMMPIFFFVSGYIAYKSTMIWDGKNYLSVLKKKTIVLIIPALFFFSIFVFSHYKNPYYEFMNNGLGGYWFTFVLFEMFMIYYTISYVSSKHVTCFLLIFSALGICILAFFRSDAVWWQTLSLENLCKYFQFFTFGILAQKYNAAFSSLLKNDIFKAFFILVFISCVLLITRTSICTTFMVKSIVQDMLVRYAGLVVVFSFFMSKEKYFQEGGGKFLVFIGKRTLDLYLIHYFFFSSLSYLTEFVQQNIVIEIVLTTLMVTCIVVLSLLVSEIIRTSEFLAHYLFGMKSEKYKL